jgi:HK97 family phage prohead protease
MLEFKTTGIVKDVSRKDRTIKGYFSIFDNVDSDGDVITKGAYTKTLESAKNRVQHLFMHSPMLGAIGKIKQLKEDNTGLYFESELLKTSLGNDVLEMYDSGAVKEHSVGFNTIKDDTKEDARYIHEIKLWEGSTVLWGANEQAVRKAFEFINNKGTDEGLYLHIKAQLEAIQDSLKDLEADSFTSKKEADINFVDAFNKYYKK